jgi:hypothetical protein
MSDTHPRFTLWQAIAAVLDLVIRNAEDLRSLARIPGPPGERGAEGPPGKLPTVKAWTDAVHYEGDVVHLDGSTYQALKDTARQPPHEDWQPVASRGVDGQGFIVRGTYSEIETYRKNDIVALGSGSFVAKHDDPGPCTGPGWQLWAGPGKRGEKGLPGDCGDRGPKGEPGVPGADIIGGRFDLKDMKLVLVRSDGATVDIDFYDFALAVRNG